jgi:hypothetical protein
VSGLLRATAQAASEQIGAASRKYAICRRLAVMSGTHNIVVSVVSIMAEQWLSMYTNSRCIGPAHGVVGGDVGYISSLLSTSNQSGLLSKADPD